MTRHRFDPLSFVFGATFVVIAAIGLIDRALLSPTDLRWIAPGALVVVGALLLALSARHGAARADADEPKGTGTSGGPEEAMRGGWAGEDPAERSADVPAEDPGAVAVEDDVRER